MPDLPTGPAELADQVMWLHGRRVDDPINAYIARTVADAHPDADQIRDAERHAYTAYNRAEQARTQLDEIIYAELRPYGRAAHTRDASRSAQLPSPTNWQTSNATCAPPPHASRPSRTNRASGRFRTEDSTANTTGGPPTAVARQQAAAREANERQTRQQEKHGGSNRPLRAGVLPTTGGASAAETPLTDQRLATMSDPVRKLLPFTSWTTAQPAQLGGRR